MRIAIVGSRKYPDLSVVRDFVNTLPEDTVVISGGAKGVDTVAERAALKRGLETRVHTPLVSDTLRYGFRTSAFNRNQKIVDDCDQLFAFWDGYSRGTLDTLKKAYRAGVFVVINLDLRDGLKLADVERELKDIKNRYSPVTI